MKDEPLSCAACGTAFDEADVNRMYTAADDRAYVKCTRCGARNEIRSERTSGLGAPPKAVVVRVIRE